MEQCLSPDVSTRSGLWQEGRHVDSKASAGVRLWKRDWGCNLWAQKKLIKTASIGLSLHKKINTRRFFMHINARTVMSSRKIRRFLPQERSIIMHLYDLYKFFTFDQKMSNLFQDALFSAFAALIFELSTELSTDSVDKIFVILGNCSTRRLTLHFIAKVNLF